MVGLAVAVAVLDELEALRGAFHLPDARVTAELTDHRLAVGDDAAGGVVVEPVHHLPDVQHAVVQPEGFGDEEAALLVDVERDRVGQARLGGEQLGLEPFGQAELTDGQLRFFRCGLNMGLPFARRGLRRGKGQDGDRCNQTGGACQFPLRHPKNGSGAGCNEATARFSAATCSRRQRVFWSIQRPKDCGSCGPS